MYKNVYAKNRLSPSIMVQKSFLTHFYADTFATYF
ncbi:hypothetical protein SAMN05421731_101309 [Acinetobacter puyangensis]|uniref:Uncharacterized protein n=1 Tax=Acinetobacter puyangensis TaxID=1096779 RepID=A0A240E4S9_9GAMM|nr:hypothetical protein SAMN05421731_101309 [Acinetobacter puyangensis]